MAETSRGNYRLPEHSPEGQDAADGISFFMYDNGLAPRATVEELSAQWDMESDKGEYDSLPRLVFMRRLLLKPRLPYEDLEDGPFAVEHPVMLVGADNLTGHDDGPFDFIVRRMLKNQQMGRREHLNLGANNMIGRGLGYIVGAPGMSGEDVEEQAAGVPVPKPKRDLQVEADIEVPYGGDYKSRLF